MLNKVLYHKSDDGVLWKDILDDISHQVCLYGGRSTSLYIFIYGLFANFVMIFVAEVL